MRSNGYDLDISKNLLFLTATLVIISSIWSLTVMTEDALAAPDKFGIDQLYPDLDEEGPVWFLNDEDPEDDENFLMTSHEYIDLEEEDEDDEDSGVFKLDAETGTQKHGVRIHADSPDDNDWKNVEMTGYFKLEDGEDEFTLVARQGPTYNDDGGCGAYGYYGMLSADGDAFFKKKLFHHGGYTDRTAVEENVVDELEDRWIGLKLVVYDLSDDEVKLELWVDDGDEENNWRKVTEYMDDGDWEVSGSNCDRDEDDIIEDGTRGGFRVDDSVFEFKKLSIREIVAEDAADEEEREEGEEDDEEPGAEEEEGRRNEIEALANLKRLVEIAEIGEEEELVEMIEEASDAEELVEIAEIGEEEELTDLEGLEEIARLSDLEGLAQLVGASDSEELTELVIPQQPLAVDDEEEEEDEE